MSVVGQARGWRDAFWRELHGRRISLGGVDRQGDPKRPQQGCAVAAKCHDVGIGFQLLSGGGQHRRDLLALADQPVNSHAHSECNACSFAVLRECLRKSVRIARLVFRVEVATHQ